MPEQTESDRLWQAVIDVFDDYAAREEASRTYTDYMLAGAR